MAFRNVSVPPSFIMYRVPAGAIGCAKLESFSSLMQSIELSEKTETFIFNCSVKVRQG